METFAIFQIFRENLGKNLEISICRGFGGGTPEVREFIKSLVEKYMETCNFLKIFMNYERIFNLKSKF